MPSKKNRNKHWLYLATAIIALAAVAVWHTSRQSKPTDSQTASSSSSQTSSQNSSIGFNKAKYSVDQASSLWAIVNKGRILPSSYVPANLVVPNVPLNGSASDSNMHVRADTAAAMEKMFASAKADGLDLMLTSGYRSYTTQVNIYSNYVKSDGQAQADTYSARPGHSEHQTGLAADLQPISGKCTLDQCFDSTLEGKWLAANSYKYGFIIRYQKDQQGLTGYEYEPWHVRYVGADLAAQIHSSGQTLEQFFGLPIYTDYPSQSFQLQL